MTNALGKGTCNLAVNMTAEERGILGRLAFQRDTSLGGLVRHFIRRGLEAEEPEVASRVVEARRRHKAAALLGVGLVAVWLSFVTNRADDATQWMRARTARRPEREMEATA